MSAPFMRNSDLTAVVIQLIVGLDATEGDNMSALLLVVLLHTLRTYNHAPVSSTTHTGITSHTQELERNLKWDEWGPEGSIILTIPRRPPASILVAHADSAGRIVWIEGLVALLRRGGFGNAQGVRHHLRRIPVGANCARRYPRECDNLDGSARGVLEALMTLLDGQRPSRVVTTHDEFAIVVSELACLRRCGRVILNPWRMRMTSMTVPTSGTLGYPCRPRHPGRGVT